MPGRTPLLGKTECLAEGLWFVHGEMPTHANRIGPRTSATSSSIGPGLAVTVPEMPVVGCQRRYALALARPLGSGEADSLLQQRARGGWQPAQRGYHHGSSGRPS